MREVSVVLVALAAGCARGPTTAPPGPAPAVVQPEPDPAVETPPEPSPVARVDASALGYLAYADGPFPNPGSLDTPRWVVAVHEPYGEDPLTEFTESLLDGDRVADVAPSDFERLGLPRSTSVWMFGDGAPCEAKLGPAYAHAYEDGFVGLEVGYSIFR